MEIQKWMRGLGFPESLQEFDEFEKRVEIDYLKDMHSLAIKSTQMEHYRY